MLIWNSFWIASGLPVPCIDVVNRMFQTFCFLLLPGFSMMGLMSAIEPLRVANRFRGELYRWRLFSQGGDVVQASNGMLLNVDGVLELPHVIRVLFVVVGFESLVHYDHYLVHWLQRCEPELVVFGGIDIGCIVS